MKRISYKRVYSKYSMSFSDRLARLSYALYRGIRLGLLKYFPLKEHEKYWFEDHEYISEESTDMPLGYSYESKSHEKGFINLKCVDFYDFLPKEDLDLFKKELRRFVLKNKPSRFGLSRTAKDEARIDNMGRYVDWRSYAVLYDATLTHNEFLEQYAPQVAVSLINLSSSFLLVKYRLYIDNKFNLKLNSIFNKKYLPYFEVSRTFNVPWYKPKKFGRAYFSGDNARTRELYVMLSNLKWRAFCELRRHFTVRFGNNQMFPPTFSTYSTNIRPDNSMANRAFWGGIISDFQPDYAPNYNVCICWDMDSEQNEGANLSAYCGGNYTPSDFLPEIAEHSISDEYAVYLTASSISRVAERDIAICNKSISKAIRNARTGAILKTRVGVEKMLYYSYRFISEFSGDTIDFPDEREFKNQMYKEGSNSASVMKGISKSISDTKENIDILLKILNDAASYVQEKSNMNLQLFMMIVTFISLIVAVLALAGLKMPDLKVLKEIICHWFTKK